jgi:hypothetical protein
VQGGQLQRGQCQRFHLALLQALSLATPFNIVITNNDNIPGSQKEGLIAKANRFNFAILSKRQFTILL